MIQVVDSPANSIVFGSRSREIDSFRFGAGKQDLSKDWAEEKLLHKGEDFTFIFGADEDNDDDLSKNDYLLISDHLSVKNDDLLAVADVQSKSLQFKG
jgi:hypothetical protein